MTEDNHIVVEDDSEEEDIVEEECPDCGKVFTDLNELASHYFSAHEAAKHTARQKSGLQNENNSGVKISQGPVVSGNQSLGKSSSQEISNSSTLTTQNQTKSSDKLSLEEKQINARKHNNNNLIPPAKPSSQIKLTSSSISNDQNKQKIKTIPQEQFKDSSKVIPITQPKDFAKEQIKEKIATNSAGPIEVNKLILNKLASNLNDKPSQNKVDVNKTDTEEETFTNFLVQYFEENNLPFKPRIRNKSDGNCWYEAIADQVVLHGIKGMPTTHEAMRKEICDALFTLPQTKSWIKNLFGGQKKRFVHFVNKHRKNGEWTDAKGLICQATALMIKRNIHIVGTANKGQSVCYTKLESVEEAEKFPALTVGYYQDQHYRSIEKIDDSIKKEDVPPKLDSANEAIDAKVDENLKMGGKIARTPIAAKPLRKMSADKIDAKINSTEVIPLAKLEHKTVREPIVSKPLRKIPTETKATNERSYDPKVSKTEATNIAGKIERISIVSKPLRKVPIDNSADQENKVNDDPKPSTDITAAKVQDVSKIEAKMPRLPIDTKPLRKENSIVSNDKKEPVRNPRTPILSKALRKDKGSAVAATIIPATKIDNVLKTKLMKPNTNSTTNNVSKDNIPKETLTQSEIPNLPTQGTIVQKKQILNNVDKPVQGKTLIKSQGKPTQIKAQSSVLKPSKFSLAARNKLLKNSAIKIQRWFRNIRKGRLVWAAFQKKKCAAIVLQTNWRSVLARKKVGKMKAALKVEAWYTKRKTNKTKAAILLQSRWKSVKARKQYLLKKAAAITVQKNCRTLLAKRLVTDMKRCKGAEKLQGWFRNVKAGRIVRKDFLRKKKAAMILQPHWRSYLAQCRGPSFQLHTPDEHIINPETGEVELADEYIINAETGELEKTPVDLGDYVNKITEFMDYGTLSNMANKTWKKSKLKNRLVSSLQREIPRKNCSQTDLDVENENNASVGPPLYLRTRKSMDFVSSEEDFENEEEAVFDDEETSYKDQDYLGQSVHIFGSFLSPLTNSTNTECFIKDNKFEIIDYVINQIFDSVVPLSNMDESFKFSQWRQNNANQQKSWLEIKVQKKKAEDKSKAVLTLQSHWRRFVVKRSFDKVKRAAIQIQTWFKNIRNAKITRQNYLKKQRATIALQSNIRSFLQRKKFMELKKSVTLIQSRRKMVLQKRTFDELKSSTIKIQRWYKNLRFAKAFLLYNSEVTSIEKNLKEYVQENDDYVSFSSINKIAIENRVGFNIRTKVFSKYQPQLLEHRKNEKNQINFIKENIDPVKDYKIYTLDGLVIVPEESTEVIFKNEDNTLETDDDDTLEEYKVVPSFNIFNSLFPTETRIPNANVIGKKRGAAKNMEKMKIIQDTLESIIEKVCSQESFLKTLSISEEIDYFNAVQIEKEEKAGKKTYRYTCDEMFDEQESNCIDQFISMRRELIISHNAPTKIQRWLRNIKAGKILRKDFLRKKKAATIIQAYRRSLVTRREFQTMRAKTRNATTLLQSHWKSLLIRRQFCKKKEAALQIQSWFRIMTVRKVLRKDFIQKKEAVKTIQSYWRALVMRRQLVKMKAATLIQASWKAHVECRKFAANKYSAIIIQRWFRNIQKGKRVRNDFLEKKKASIKIQAQWRGLVARNKWETHTFSKSIVSHLLDEVVRKNRAATIIQSVWRSCVVRRKFLLEKKTVVRAVTTIQCQWKMWLTRKLFLKEKEACVAIQKWTRNLKIGKEKRKEFIAMKVSAVVLQSNWRGLFARRKCTALRTVNGVVNALLEDAAYPRSVAEEILDDSIVSSLKPRENVDSILNVVISDIFRPIIPVKSLKNYGKPSSKKGSSVSNALKRKRSGNSSNKHDIEEFVVKKKRADGLSMQEDIGDIIPKRKRVDSFSKEGDLEDIVVVKEVKRRQTDFMVEDVSLPNKKTCNDFDAINVEKTLIGIKETLNIMKDLPVNNVKNDPILENMKEDPDIVEIYAPTRQSSSKAVGKDINVVETIFKCPECFNSFNISSDYQNHITTICGVVKAEPVIKVEHETIDELQCNLCEATFSDVNGMDIHRTFFHGGRQLQSESQDMFKSKDLLIQNQEKDVSIKRKERPHKTMVSENSAENSFETQNLESLFKNIEQKIKSAKTVPPPLIDSQAIAMSTDIPNKDETSIQITKCDECGKLRKRKETKKAALVWLLNHRKECFVITNSKPFKCVQCSTSFSSNTALFAHKEICRPNENVKPASMTTKPSKSKPGLVTAKQSEPSAVSQKKLAKQLASRLKQISMYEEKEKTLKKKRKIPSYGYGNAVEKLKYNKKIKLDNTIVENIIFIDQ